MHYTLSSAAHSDFVIKKSRFIGLITPVSGREEAQKIVHEIWQQHPSATHVCWALLAGGHSAAVDDGEPGGTAGRPMLEVLRHHDLEGVLAVAIRYYGGIPLGAGGLVRAYTDTVVQAPYRTFNASSSSSSICLLDCYCFYINYSLVRIAFWRFLTVGTGF